MLLDSTEHVRVEVGHSISLHFTPICTTSINNKCIMTFRSRDIQCKTMLQSALSTIIQLTGNNDINSNNLSFDYQSYLSSHRATSISYDPTHFSSLLTISSRAKQTQSVGTRHNSWQVYFVQLPNSKYLVLPNYERRVVSKEKHLRISDHSLLYYIKKH